MIIFIDIGVILLFAFILILFFVGSISSLLEFVLANLVGFTVAFLIIGLLVGILLSLLSRNKFAWFSCAITTPAVYIYPFLIAIPHIADKFHKDFGGTLLTWPLWLIGMIAIFVILFGIHYVAACGFEDSDRRSPLSTFIAGVVGAGLQCGSLYLMYLHWLA